ncbi:MAG: hypothetical protein AB8G26_01240 [Ilumatobacter sp.]
MTTLLEALASNLAPTPSGLGVRAPVSSDTGIRTDVAVLLGAIAVATVVMISRVFKVRRLLSPDDEPDDA